MGIDRIDTSVDARLGAQQSALKVNARLGGSSPQAMATVTEAAAHDLRSKERGEDPVQGKDPDNVTEALASHDGWNENALNSLQQSTYSIRLFVIDDEPFDIGRFETYEDLVGFITKTKKQTTIVQSGVTGLNISNLNISSTPGPNGQTRSMMVTTSIEMTVVEPGGISFMDVLADATKELRVKNYAKSQFFMEVKFQGYQGEGDIGGFNMNPCANFQNQGVWLYRLVLLEINTDVTAAGGTYRLSFKPFDEQIQDSQELRLPGAISAVGSSVKEMVDDLMRQMNEQYKQMYGYEFRTYKAALQPFYFDKVAYDPNDEAEFKLTPAKPQNNDKRAVTMESTGDKYKAHFAHGTQLHDAIEMIFANCEKAQQLAKNVMKQGQLNKDDNTMRESVVFRIHPIAEAVEYDYASESYLLAYTLVVKPYLTQRPILHRDEVIVAQNSKTQADNVMKLRRGGYLAKRYDYLFTGVNTEIISFDIKHNAKWSALLPRVAGDTNSIETNVAYDLALKREINNYRSELQDIKNKLDAIQSTNHQIETLSKANGKNNEDAIRELKAQQPSFSQIDHLLTQRDSIIERLGGKRADLQARENARNGKVPEDRSTNRYAEELASDLGNEKSRYDPMPLSIIQNHDDTRFYASGAMSDFYHRDRSIFGAVMDQLYETTGSALQTINLEIRGDPYWLGASNLEKTHIDIKNAMVPVQLTDPASKDDNRPNYSIGDVLFLLTYRYPRGFTEGGAPDIRFNDFFTGVYYLVTVHHKFEGGQFTQSLTGKRMPMIEVFRAFGLRTKEEVAELERADDQKRYDALRTSNGGRAGIRANQSGDTL